MATRSQTRKAPPRFAVRVATRLRQLLLRAADRMLPAHLAAAGAHPRVRDDARPGDDGRARSRRPPGRGAADGRAARRHDRLRPGRVAPPAAGCRGRLGGPVGRARSLPLHPVHRGAARRPRERCRGLVPVHRLQRAAVGLAGPHRVGAHRAQRLAAGARSLDVRVVRRAPGRGPSLRCRSRGADPGRDPGHRRRLPVPHHRHGLRPGRRPRCPARRPARRPPGPAGRPGREPRLCSTRRAATCASAAWSTGSSWSRGTCSARSRRRPTSYLLKWILHDWDDPTCVRLVRSVAATMPAGSRLVVVEGSQPRNTVDPRFSMIDLQMLVVTEQGRERSADELAALLAAGGSRAGVVRQLEHRTAAGRGDQAR